jgi:glucuronate isomerase
MWLGLGVFEVFGMGEMLSAENADLYFDTITDQLATDAFRPRALFDRYNIEVIATTESPLDSLEHHAAIMAENAAGGWQGRVVTAYRPDPVVDPEFEGFRDNLKRLARSRARIADMGRLPCRAPQAPRLFRRPWRDQHRPRPPHRADRQPLAAEAEALFDRGQG